METSKQRQIRHLERIFSEGSLSPIFRPNDKHETKGVPRIAYSDVMGRKYAIRDADNSEIRNGFWDQKARIVAEYKSIEDLVNDGWTLD